MQTELAIGDTFESKATIQAQKSHNEQPNIPADLHDKFIPRGETMHVIDPNIYGYIKVQIGDATSTPTSENIRYIKKTVFEKRVAERFIVAVEVMVEAEV